MIITDAEWLNTMDRVVQYAAFETEHPKLRQIIAKEGFYFDANYWYWLSNHIPSYVKRAPLWTYPQKKIDYENVTRHAKGLKKMPGEQLTLFFSNELSARP
jgi:hypothetical protein